MYLSFDEDIALLLAEAFKKDTDSDAMCLAKAAKIIRRELFEIADLPEGTFPPDCQENSVPQTLLALILMILEGPNILDKASYSANQAALSTSQLLKFNSVKRI